MRKHRFHSLLFASAAALAVGCAGQGEGDQNSDPVDLQEQVCSTKSSDCPVICAKEGFGECGEVDPCLKNGDLECEIIDPCEKNGDGCEPPPPDPCIIGLKHYEECPPPPPPPPPTYDGCTLTQGFWKNHPGAWPLDGLTFGEFTFNKAALLAIFDLPVEGNAFVNLMHQYIAASLNIAADADPSDVAGTMEAAHLWLEDKLEETDGALPEVDSASTDGQYALGLKDILDLFNNGEIGPGHCDENGAPNTPPIL